MTVRTLTKLHGVPLALFVALPLLAFCLEGAAGQSQATLRVEENLRSEPQGTILGRLQGGSSFPIVAVQGSWVQLNVEGWIWTASLQTTDRLGFDLMVSASPQENLRAEPSGAILARMAQGTLFERLDDAPGWTRVRRTAWVWRASVELSGPPPATSPATRPQEAPVSPAVPEGEGERWFHTGAERAPILTGPDGDTLALAQPGTELQILAREGNWIRVRLDGWSWAPRGASPDSATTETPLSQASPEDVARNPDGYRGRVVSWDLQFVSLERAESIRTDFYEGEPFLLTRTASQGGRFIYVAVPPDRLGEVEGLIPLERIRVVGRIRTGAAALTGNTVLELLEITRLSEGPAGLLR